MRELKTLRKLAHHLKPVVRIGQNGLTDAVVRELDLALAHHQLVKLKLAADGAEARDQQVARVSEASDSIVVQRVGRTVTLFRRNPERPAPGAAIDSA